MHAPGVPLPWAERPQRPETRPILNSRFTKRLRGDRYFRPPETLHLPTTPRERPLRSHWALKSAAAEPLGAQNHCLRSRWALKSVALEPLGVQIGCSGATGRSNLLLWSHWALKLAAPEPLGAQIGCSGATGRSNLLLRSLQASKPTCCASLCFRMCCSF